VEYLLKDLPFCFVFCFNGLLCALLTPCFTQTVLNYQIKQHFSQAHINTELSGTRAYRALPSKNTRQCLHIITFVASQWRHGWTFTKSFYNFAITRTKSTDKFGTFWFQLRGKGNCFAAGAFSFLFFLCTSFLDSPDAVSAMLHMLFHLTLFSHIVT